MTDYSSQTVAQLKELLKTKNLPLDGKKADLVKRLTEADSEPAPAEEGETEAAVAEPVAAIEAEEPVAAEETNGTNGTNEGEPATTEAVSSEPAAEAETETEPVKEEKPKPKVLTPEERKQLAIELLNKKIHRAEKFGDEALATEAKKDLARVEKFGVELGTALAREIGAVDTALSDKKGFKKNFKKRNNYKKGFRGRNKRN